MALYNTLLEGLQTYQIVCDTCRKAQHVYTKDELQAVREGLPKLPKGWTEAEGMHTCKACAR